MSLDVSGCDQILQSNSVHEHMPKHFATDGLTSFIENPEYCSGHFASASFFTPLEKVKAFDN